MPSLLAELAPLATTSADGRLVIPATLAVSLLTRAGGGQPLDQEMAEKHVASYTTQDGMVVLEDFCAAHDTERPEPLPGFLVAAFPADDYFGDGDKVTDQHGDGPPSTDDESEDEAVGELNGEKPSWSIGGGSREASFRQREPEKVERAAQIRSSCLTSHLVTPAFKGRKLVVDAPALPAGAQTIGSRPRQLRELPADLGPAKKDPDNGSFKVSTNRKKTLGKLSAMAIA